MSLFTDIKDFLTLEEIERVRVDVIKLRDDWRVIYPDEQQWVPVAQRLAEKGQGFYILGDSVYLMATDGKTPEDVDRGIQTKLQHNFRWLTDKVVAQIKELTGRPTFLHPVTYPGFHISTLPIQFKPERLHVDTSIIYYADVDPKNIRSVLLLIDEPDNGAWLEYADDNNIIKTKRYEIGTFHMWEGMMFHRIGELKAEGRPRITYQAHFFYDPKSYCNWIYF